MDARTTDAVTAVLDWSVQRAEFSRDGTLRDIYVQGTKLADWKTLLSVVGDAKYHVKLERGGAVVAMPANVASLFDAHDRYQLAFSIGDVVVDCHLFSTAEIELSFTPEVVDEAALRGLLEFMVELGEATRKSVTMTMENAPQAPLFRYEIQQGRLRWITR